MSSIKTVNYIITTEYIKLDQLLKVLGIASTGGEAKVLIAAGKIGVNEEIEKKRGRKIRPGDRVEILDTIYYIQ